MSELIENRYFIVARIERKTSPHRLTFYVFPPLLSGIMTRASFGENPARLTDDDMKLLENSQ